jgi:hypothetical protein
VVDKTAPCIKPCDDQHKSREYPSRHIVREVRAASDTFPISKGWLACMRYAEGAPSTSLTMIMVRLMSGDIKVEAANHANCRVEEAGPFGSERAGRWWSMLRSPNMFRDSDM